MAEEDTLIAGSGDDTEAASVSASSSLSPSPSFSSSPKTSEQKIKLRCSHGGKIMVRPPDGHLKYIGGETRVVAIPRDITFSELMKKLSNLVDGDVVLKYQLLPDDLDILVSVQNDEDLKHMLDEYNRQERVRGTPKLRAYLFPSKPIVIESSPSLSYHALEQRYTDAINGIIRTTLPLNLRTTPSSSRPSFSISSPGMSPKVTSPDKIQNPWDASNCSSPKRQLPMHRVRSSPSLYFGGESQQQGSGGQLSRQQGLYQANRYHPQPQGHLYHPQHHGGRWEHVRGGLVLGPGGMDRFYPAGGRPHKLTRGLYEEGSSPIDSSDGVPYYKEG